MCVAVTCHLHFWHNDRGLLRATAVTQGWNGYRNQSQHKKLTLEKKILPPAPAGTRTRDLSITTELSSLPYVSCCFFFVCVWVGGWVRACVRVGVYVCHCVCVCARARWNECILLSL